MACSKENPGPTADESLSFRISELPKSKLSVHKTCCLGEFFKTADERTILSSSSPEFRTPYLCLPRKPFVINLLKGVDEFRMYQDRADRNNRYWFTNCLEWIRSKGQGAWSFFVSGPLERETGRKKVPFDVVTRNKALVSLVMLQNRRRKMTLIAYCCHGTVYLYGTGTRAEVTSDIRKKVHGREKFKLCCTSDQPRGRSNWSETVDQNQAYFRVYGKKLIGSYGQINILFPVRIDAVDPADNSSIYPLVVVPHYFHKASAASLPQHRIVSSSQIAKLAHVRSKLIDSKSIIYGIRDRNLVRDYDKVEMRDVGREYLEEGWTPDSSYELLAALLQRIVETARRYSGKYVEFDFREDPDSDDDMLVDVKVLDGSADLPFVFPEWYSDFLDNKQ